MSDVQYHAMPATTGNGARRIAYRHTPGDGPVLVFLPGYMSDMAGGKATAIFDRASAQGQACLLLDYSGCGLSEGHFADGTLARWRDEVLALIGALGLGEVVLIGSSMGGWLMLLVGEALGWNRVAGLVGIAAAPDFTEWSYDAMQKRALAAGQPVLEDNPYGPEPTPTYPGFWADGQANRRLNGTIAYDGPVRLIHGMDDDVVPSDIALRLTSALRSGRVQVTFVKGGDHRLSRDEDIALLITTIAALPAPQ